MSDNCASHIESPRLKRFQAAIEQALMDATGWRDDPIWWVGIDEHGLTVQVSVGPREWALNDPDSWDVTEERIEPLLRMIWLAALTTAARDIRVYDSKGTLTSLASVAAQQEPLEPEREPIGTMGTNGAMMLRESILAG